MSFASVLYTCGWKTLLWLQRAWSVYLPVAVKRGVVLVDVDKTVAKRIIFMNCGARAAGTVSRAPAAKPH